MPPAGRVVERAGEPGVVMGADENRPALPPPVQAARDVEGLGPGPERDVEDDAGLPARAADPGVTELLCFDEELASAARLEGFRGDAVRHPPACRLRVSLRARAARLR